MRVENLARFEVKYAVRPDQLDEIRSVLRLRCVTDGFAPAAKNGWYSVDSLYFDTPDWRIFQAAENRQLVRHKLRVRIYPDSPDSVVKIEVKRRLGEQQTKTSTLVPQENWAAWLAPGCDTSRSPSLAAFSTLQRATGAFPRVLVRYQRQAFKSIVDDYVRITFDREMCFQPMECYSLDAHPLRWTAVDGESSFGRGGHLLMEVKFKQRPPVWISDLVCRLLEHMRRSGMRQCTPTPGDDLTVRAPLLGLSSGYITRTVDRFPKQGTRAPWKVAQNYFYDYRQMRRSDVVDAEMVFSNPRSASAPVAARSTAGEIDA